MRCAADTKETVGIARDDRRVAGARLKSGNANDFMTPNTDNSNVMPATSCACVLNGKRAHEKALEVNDFAYTTQGDTTDIKTSEMSATAPKLVTTSERSIN